MFPSIDRVYVNERAKAELGWQPRYDFTYLIHRLEAGEEIRSRLAKEVGSKGYHPDKFAEGPYPISGSDTTEATPLDQGKEPKCRRP